ncbi:MAG: FHA domain-containing protein [Acidobacteria bacterium]|nr:MAG: FHA domain-containing protein [Acidobacteriota bacterium]
MDTQSKTRQAKARGRDIILAIVENMQEALEPLLYSIVAPSRFDVYVHEDDYDRIIGILDRIRSESKRALDARVKQMNSKPLFGRDPIKVEPADGDWFVRVLKAEEENFEPGDILVDSALTMPVRPEFGVGAKTQRVVTVRSRGESRRIRNYVEEARAAEPRFARFNYKDRNGQRREVFMTKKDVLVGRGGENIPCDLELTCVEDVSRSHFYLRVDEEKGREFWIQDVSKFGTAVNGRKLEKGQWTLLPAKAVIRLAEKVDLEFEAL